MPPGIPEAGRPADPGEEVDQGGALEAEGTADRPLAGAAVSGAPSDRPGKTATDSPAEGRARYRSQGRLSSWFVRLCVKSGRFVTSGQYGRIGCPWVAESKMPLLALENSADFRGIFFRLKEPMVE
jgi:hypothetical protein